MPGPIYSQTGRACARALARSRRAPDRVHAGVGAFEPLADFGHILLRMKVLRTEIRVSARRLALASVGASPGACWRCARAAFLLAALAGGILGCSFQPGKPITPADLGASHYHHVASQVEYPTEPVPERRDDFAACAPHVIHEGPPEYWDLRLEEALQIGLTNSPVLRDLGAQVLQFPTTMRTIQSPGITETDPRFGIEAALSYFDAQFTANALWQKGDRALNNLFFGGGTRVLQQDYNTYMTEISKRAATGTQYFLRHNTIYDSNNAPANLFPSAWDTNIEAEVRQPLLQGAGVEFNRIAGGPNSVIGFPNGVLIARVNTDISLAEFEVAVRNLVSNIENCYWDLYFAYRDLHAKVVARDSALETWRRIHALYVTGRRGGEADKEAQARDQYFFFQSEVEDALTGRLFDGTRTNNGSSGGTFRANPGVYVTERRLRLMMGVPPNDKRLIRPAEEPLQAKVGFDWDELTTEALGRRPELRRQRWVVKRRELELVAARNFLLPRLDAQGLYRWRGFGHDLLDPRSRGLPQFDNAYQTLFDGNFQEWQLGAQFQMPLGYRQGHAAVRNAQLNLARERAILREQELQVVYDLSNAVGDVDRSYTVAQTNFNRRVAATQQLQAIQAAFDADTATLLDLVEAQRRLADADSRYARSMCEYTLAVKNVMFENGTLLANNGINLAEGPWPEKAYRDAQRRDSHRSRPLRLSYILPQGPLLSGGKYPQSVFPPPVLIEDAPKGGDGKPWEVVPLPPNGPQPLAPPDQWPDRLPTPSATPPDGAPAATPEGAGAALPAPGAATSHTAPPSTLALPPAPALPSREAGIVPGSAFGAPGAVTRAMVPAAPLPVTGIPSVSVPASAVQPASMTAPSQAPPQSGPPVPWTPTLGPLPPGQAIQLPPAPALSAPPTR